MAERGGWRRAGSALRRLADAALAALGRGTVTVSIHIPQTDDAAFAEIKTALLAWRARHAAAIRRSWITAAPRLRTPRGRRPQQVVLELRRAALADVPAGAVVTRIPPLVPVQCLAASAPARTPDGRGGEREGTKHFAPGAEVFFHNVFSGDGYERAYATGRHRDTGRFITIMQPTKRFTGWRATVVTDPIVLFELRQYGHGWMPEHRITAETMAAEMLRREALAAGAEPGEA